MSQSEICLTLKSFKLYKFDLGANFQTRMTLDSRLKLYGQFTLHFSPWDATENSL